MYVVSTDMQAQKMHFNEATYPSVDDQSQNLLVMFKGFYSKLFLFCAIRVLFNSKGHDCSVVRATS